MEIFFEADCTACTAVLFYLGCMSVFGVPWSCFFNMRTAFLFNILIGELGNSEGSSMLMFFSAVLRHATSRKLQR